ncbi:MAG: SUMF1/EgtB/PvdO family nonheme iron enzyme [Sedimentisphaerales bacterium]|nr:SUMF1/EgtB/PvdO family nonheme iron enzyme [Sedimentisphaerales bacterium]
MRNSRIILLVIVAGLCLSNLPISLAVCPSADVSGDCRVDLEDFSILAEQWLMGYDTDDLAIMATEWLMEGIPEDPCNLLWVSINDPGVDGHEGFDGQMSKYETTNAQYCEFLNAALASGDIIVGGDNIVYGANGSNSGTDFVGQVYYDLAGLGLISNGATSGGAARINWTGNSFTVDSGFENHPVTCVSWYGSTAFCNYYGFRLPTEWEWQAVADHTIVDPYAYGCGPSINNSIANYYNSTHPDGTTVVGDFGTYGYGMCDMAGNVWEWTSSGSDLIIRGGCWASTDYDCTVARRLYCGLGPHRTAYTLGFRVCR